MSLMLILNSISNDIPSKYLIWGVDVSCLLVEECA